MTSEHEKQKPPLPLLVFRLRALVLALGESTAPAWWKTEFMNETGLRFLERLYPRTSFLAAVHAAGKAASDTHDRAVGRVGVYHLFRLPESLETELHRMPPDPADDFFPTLRNALGRPGELMQLLAPMCGGEGADASPGAKKIGTDKDLMTTAGLRRTAAVYHAAFVRNKPGFPYFTAETVGGR
ncbi:BrxE family protein [Aminirod propionatiphilus]|uniref:BrxE family protein n=1 Tax=Aminirod propionatiphilus TaxID=3415223 RepID=A0ACD1DTY7_9BACT|nr:BrxE family protein [Synergistota bacterium]